MRGQLADRWGLVARVCQPSTLRTLVWPEARSAQNSRGAICRRQHGLCFDPSFELLVQPLNCIRSPRWPTRLIERRLRSFRRPHCGSVRIDETYVRVRGQWRYLYRAIDKHDAPIDFLLTAQRDLD